VPLLPTYPGLPRSRLIPVPLFPTYPVPPRSRLIPVSLYPVPPVIKVWGFVSDVVGDVWGPRRRGCRRDSDVLGLYQQGLRALSAIFGGLVGQVRAPRRTTSAKVGALLASLSASNRGLG